MEFGIQINHLNTSLGMANVERQRFLLLLLKLVIAAEDSCLMFCDGMKAKNPAIHLQNPLETHKEFGKDRLAKFTMPWLKRTGASA